MADFVAEATKAGVVVDSGGLAPTSVSTRIRISDGALNVVDGPFTETEEVIGGYAIYEVDSQVEAVEWSRRLMELHRRHWPGWTGGSEVRQMFSPGGP